MGSLLTEKQSNFKIVLQGFMYWPFKPCSEKKNKAQSNGVIEKFMKFQEN